MGNQNIVNGGRKCINVNVLNVLERDEARGLDDGEVEGNAEGDKEGVRYVEFISRAVGGAEARAAD